MITIEELQETIDRLVFKYDIKKEYFTVVLPVLIGLTIILVAFMTGHTLTAQNTTEDNADKQKAMEEMMKELNMTDDTVASSTQTAAKAPPSFPDLDHYIIYGVIIACIPFSIDRFFERRKHMKYEDDFTQFLFKLSEMMRAGIDPIKSVIELSKTDVGSLTPYVKTAASMMVLGRSFEEGMKNMSSSLHSEMISKYVELVIQASYMGGSVHDLILKASEDMRTMLVIENEMLGNLKQYTVIFYLAQAIIIFIAYVLSAQLIPFIQGPGSSSIFGSGDLQKIDFTHSFFHLIMINAAIGGLIIGKISEGSMKDGFKHSVILMSVSYLICVVAIIPLSAGSSDYIITPISGDNQTTMPGTMLKDPIVFKVTDSKGNPVPNTNIQFTIEPSGTIRPSYMKTDNSSLASIRVTLGIQDSEYTITAKVASSTGSVTIKKSTSYG